MSQGLLAGSRSVFQLSQRNSALKEEVQCSGISAAADFSNVMILSISRSNTTSPAFLANDEEPSLAESIAIPDSLAHGVRPLSYYRLLVDINCSERVDVSEVVPSMTTFWLKLISSASIIGPPDCPLMLVSWIKNRVCIIP